MESQMRTDNRPSLFAATLSLSMVIASGFAFAPSAHAQSAPAVSQTQGTNADGSPATYAPSLPIGTGVGTINANALQFFSNGATFPAIVLRNLLDFNGVAIPNTGLNIGQVGSQGTQPLNSPRINSVQYNYCSTGSGNGRATYTGTANASTTCSYVTAIPNAVTSPLVGSTLSTGVSTASGQVTPSGTIAFTPYPAYPTGPSANPAVATAAPLFAFSDSTASTSALTGFGAGPAFPAGTNLAVYTTNKKPTRGNPIQVPVFFGAIVPIVNASVNGGVSPNLTTVDLCNVFAGVPTTVGGVPVVPVVRSDSSGTTTAFTAYLASVCGAGYYLNNTQGVAVFPTAVGSASELFARAPGNDGLSDVVAGGTTVPTNPGPAGTLYIGYAESAFAQPLSATSAITNVPAPIQAALQSPVAPNPFLTSSLASVRAALTNITLVADSTYPCVLTVQGLNVAPTTATAYPIVTQTYALTYTNYPTQAEVTAVRGAFSFILGNRTNVIQANDQITQERGFILLGRTLAPNGAISLAAINPLRTAARNCVNSAKVGVGPN
jgi:ABC-type phosphate transport system substrate-binding protein